MQSDNVLNVDQKFSKNHDDLMRFHKVIASQRFKKC